MAWDDLDHMRILTPDGLRVIPVVHGSDAASTIGSHWNAIKTFRDTGNQTALRRFKATVIGGVRIGNLQVGGYRLATDPAMIRQWAKLGDLDIEDPYAPLGGDR